MSISELLTPPDWILFVDPQNTSPAVMLSLVLGNSMWTIVYLFAIRRGFVDKTFTVPIVGLTANFMWEIIFAFLYPPSPPINWVMMSWVVLDCILVYQFLKFGADDFLPNVSPQWRFPVFGATAVVSFALIISMARQLRDSGWHAAFALNLVESLLWITMILRRNDVRGQSLYIAVLKGAGSAMVNACFFALFGFYAAAAVLCITTAVADVIYIALVYRKSLELGLNPWRRA